jgi:VanZ family protein
MIHRLPVLLAWFGAFAVIVLSLVPIELRPHVLESKQHEHFGAYFATGAVFAMAYTKEWARVAAAIFLSGLAGALEIAQQWVPGRDSSVLDWAASSIGACAGIGCMLVILWFGAAAGRNSQ